jgi:DNA sulfur modification protein DndC
MSTLQSTLFDDQKMTLSRALDLTAESLIEYGQHYKHWAIAYSGGKDSTATVAAVCYLLTTGRVPAPESLTIMYADTRQELPPLQIAAMRMLGVLRERGHRVIQVLPKMDDRYFVYMLGRGVPPPNNNTLRWCTSQLKIEPMDAALQQVSAELGGEKFLLLTGVRVGESAARDQRITASCGKNGAECGQGWFQLQPPKAASDVLAPLLHWRICHVWDWLTFEELRHGLPTSFVAEAYGGDEAQEIGARTGCIGCPLASNDNALDTVVAMPQWAYLAPLKRLRPIYEELRLFRNRLQKHGERNKGGKLSANPDRKGPLTMKAREWALGEVLAIQAEVNAAAVEQGRPLIDLINDEELARIRELIAANTWPQRWTGDEPAGDLILDKTFSNGAVQPLLPALEEMV